MHLDTVCTMVDADKIVMYPNVADSLRAYAVTAPDPDEAEDRVDAAGLRRRAVPRGGRQGDGDRHAAPDRHRPGPRHRRAGAVGRRQQHAGRGPPGGGRLRAQRRHQRPAGGGRHRGDPDRRLRAGIGPRRAPVHELPGARESRWRPERAWARRGNRGPGRCRRGRQQRPGRSQTYPPADPSAQHRGACVAHDARHPGFTAGSADRHLPVGQSVAGRTLLRGEVRASASASASAVANRSAGSSSASAPVPSGRSQTGVSRPWARNMPTKRESGTSTSSPATWSRARASSSSLLGLGHHPAQVLLGPDVGPVRRGHPGQLLGGVHVALACSRAPIRSGASGTSATQKSKPGCTVTSSVRRDQVLQPRPLPRVVGEPHGAGLVLRERRRQHGAEVAGRVAEVVLHLQRQPDLAALAHHRGSRAGEQRHERDVAVAVVAAQRQRRRGGRHQLAQRHDVALGRQPLEGAADEDRAAPPGAPWHAL